MSWHIAPCLVVLRDQVNAAWPNRNKASDGFIGDTAHASGPSDHNPNSEGAVCAFDITHDPGNGPDIAVLFEQFRTHPHVNCKYLIANRQIASRSHGWTVRPYTGDPHTNHLHVSVGVGSDGQSLPGTYNDLSPWALSAAGGGGTEEDDMYTQDDRDLIQKTQNLLIAVSGQLGDIQHALSHVQGVGDQTKVELDAVKAELDAIKAKVGV